MELKYLHTFKTILETGSFQNAARRLNYTQSTITFQIQQLERELHVRLFEKIGRKMVLTEAAKTLLPHVDSILQELDLMINAGKAASKLTGPFQIALPESLLVYQMQPILETFCQQAPNVRLSLQMRNCKDILDALADGSIDIGVHYALPKPYPPLLSEPLSSYPISLVASPQLAEEQRDFMQCHQKKELPLLYGDPDSVYHQLFCAYLKERDILFSSRLQIQSIEAIKRCAASNLGIAFLPRFAVLGELKEGRLLELQTGLSDLSVTAMVSHHKNKWMSPAMALFIRLLRGS